jgi:ferredoxin-type protein NapH
MECCMANQLLNAANNRRILQWFLVPIVFVTIGLGWKFPVIGYIVPLVMITGLVGSARTGRYVCGNLCPRGAFFDRVFMRKGRHLPKAFKNTFFRWTIFCALMGFMAYQISLNPGNWEHWGKVFWLMCAVTTSIGVVLAVLLHPRSWCSFCPMGTMQNTIGGNKALYKIEPTCKECHVCEKVCPMDLPIVIHKVGGVLHERDCLKCSECVAACPTGALHH